MRKSTLFISIILFVISCLSFADDNEAKTKLATAIKSVEETREGPVVEPVCSECEVREQNVNFENGRRQRQRFVDFYYLNDVFPYYLYLEPSKVYRESDGALDNGLTHGYGLTVGGFLSSNVSISFSSNMHLFTESVGAENYRSYLELKPELVARGGGQFATMERKHVVKLKIFSKNPNFYIVLGGGFHQLDSRDRDSVTSGIYQQDVLHNQLDIPGVDLVGTFHNIDPRFRPGLLKTNGNGFLINPQIGVSRSGLAGPVRNGPGLFYAVDLNFGVEHSTLTGRTNLRAAISSELIFSNTSRREGRGIFLTLHPVVVSHPDGIYGEINVGAGYQFDYGSSPDERRYLRVGYQNSFPFGVRDNYQLLNGVSESTGDEGRVGSLYLTYGF